MSSDSVIFTESINNDSSQSEMTDKQFLYVNDNNNSNYSSQIVFDTTPLSTNGGYISWMESFLSIPLVLQIESPGITALTNLDFAVGLKSGFWQILNSITVELNGSNIVQQVSLINVISSFRANTSWSQDSLKNWGSVCGFYPDTAPSWLYCSAVQSQTNSLSPNGTGICNNRNACYNQINSIASTTLNATTGLYLTTVINYQLSSIASSASNNCRRAFNDGFTQRQKWLNYNISINSGATITDFTNNQAGLSGTINNISNYAQTFQSYVSTGVIGTTGYRAIMFDAIIRMKDITDFFGRCPLMKGGTMRMYISTNQVYFTGCVDSGTMTTAGIVTYTNALALLTNPVILGGGQTNPVMVASADIGQGMYNLNPFLSTGANATSVNFSVALSIVKTQFSQCLYQATCPITSCRLYAPCYTMSPIVESRYLTLNATKKVVYNDVFMYQFPTVGAGASFNLLISNGIPNIREIVLIPLLSQVSNGLTSNYATIGGANNITTSTLLSPFTTTGATPDPISITNLNFLISGKNLFLNQEQYNYEMFIEQLASSNQLNGNMTSSMASGLIGMHDFNSLYRYYYANASRCNALSEDGVPKAVQMIGTNNSTQIIDLLVFVTFEKSCTLDLRTGQRIG